MQPDAELLRQYHKEGSEAAFGELVRRYVGLVYSAAVRQAGGNRTLAEDVTQAVFVLLARRGPSPVGEDSIAGWLHTCTRYTTLRTLRDQRRRQARELKAAVMEINESGKVCWDDVRPLLDEAVSRLSAADRQAVLLRFFQGRSHREVGTALGLSEDAARMRVDRALEKLRGYFARRGIIATGTLLGEVISANAAEVEPAGLAGRVGRSSTLASAIAGVGSGFLSVFLMTTKNKILSAILVILVAWLLTLSLPKWVGVSAPEAGLASTQPKKSAESVKSGQMTVQPPIAAPVAAAASPLATPEKMAALTVASGQMASGASPPPPAPATGFGPAGARRGTGANNSTRNLYSNFFVQRKFTAEQENAFLKVLNERQAQVVDVNRAASSKLSNAQFSELMQNASQQMDLTDPRSRDPWAISNALESKVNDALGVTAQLQAVNTAAEEKLRQLLGEDNYKLYLDYTRQDGVRQWVNTAYGRALQSAGVEALTIDQQEALVGIVAKSIRLGDPAQALSHVDEVVGQAQAVLTPEQVEVLKTNPQGLGLSYARLHRAP